MREEYMRTRNGVIRLDNGAPWTKYITIASWDCKNKDNPYENICINTEAMPGCPVVVYDADGPTIVGSVQSTEWNFSPSVKHFYTAKCWIFSIVGPDVFADNGTVELLFDKESGVAVPCALVVERVPVSV